MPIKTAEGQPLIIKTVNGFSPLSKASTQAVPVFSFVEYDPNGSEPSNSMIQVWAHEVDASEIYGNYSSVLRMAATAAHRNKENARVAVQKKIACLRERAMRFSNGG